MNSDISLAGNMDVFNPAQRAAHSRVTMQLLESVQTIHEVAHGYEFTFPNDSSLIVRVAEFIANERLCCPFLKFHLTISSTQEPIAFTLTGPIGTQEFLRAEFEGAFG